MNAEDQNKLMKEALYYIEKNITPFNAKLIYDYVTDIIEKIERSDDEN